MDPAELHQIIANQHARQAPPASRVPREALASLSRLAVLSQVVAITGLRRCGKSVLIDEIRNTQKERDYRLTFDDERLAPFTVADFARLEACLSEIYGRQNTWYFDEIQNIPGWERFVRRLHDDGAKVWVTGSNAKALSREFGTHLTGRHVRLELWPFSFGEHRLFRGQGPAKVPAHPTTHEGAAFVRQFNRYLDEGGLPEYLASGNLDVVKFQFEGILYRDLLARYRIDSERPLRELILHLASGVGKPCTFNSLRKTIGLGSPTTVKDWAQHLEDVYFAFFVPAYDASLKRQLLAPKKVYLADAALAKLLGFRESEDRGRFLENAVYLELRRRGGEVFHHRGRRECDFLLRQGLRIREAIQVCESLSRAETREREFTGLQEAMESYGLKKGLLLTLNEEGSEKTPAGRVEILPAWKWMLRAAV